MKIGKYFIQSTPDSEIMRPNERKELVACKGFLCMIYDEPECEIEIDDFALAVGHEIPDTSEKSLEAGIRWFMKTYYKVEEKNDQEVDETTDMITAEDLVEQAVYAANAPKCCSPAQQAENMLGMLGANIMDDSIYHKEEDQPGEQAPTGETVEHKMSDERKTHLIDEFIGWMIEHHNNDEDLFYTLHKVIGLTQDELHDFSVESLDEYFDKQKKEADEEAAEETSSLEEGEGQSFGM